MSYSKINRGATDRSGIYRNDASALCSQAFTSWVNFILGCFFRLELNCMAIAWKVTFWFCVSCEEVPVVQNLTGKTLCTLIKTLESSPQRTL